MLIRIRTIDFTATGREILRNRDVDAAQITVGRGSENAIHLPDLAVEQQHLRISQQASGALLIEAAGSLGFTLDGRTTSSASVDPARGGEVGAGSYRLEIGQDGDGAALITVRRIAEDTGELKDRLRGFGLERALPSRRIMSWALLTAILLAFLAVPIWSHYHRPEAKPDIDAHGQVNGGHVTGGQVLMDASWSTGALSSAHHGLEDQCEACHTTPFVAVRDDACLACHTQTADHAEAPRMAHGRATPGRGEAMLRQVADAFNKPGPGACTDCHTEHEGAGRMEPTSEQFCADCHATLDARLTDTALGNAADFGRIHPQFQALVTPGRGAREVRLAVDEVRADFGGLKFPHDMHLSGRNGVARMAGRLGIAQGGLDCASCHTPSVDGVRFQPVNMEDSCEACHSLVYDRVDTTFRSLRHGNVDAMQADLAAMDRAPRRPVATGRRRPGMFAQGGIYYGNFSRVSSTGLSPNALAPGGICGECHFPAGSGLDVVPVAQPSRYFQHGWFDHNAHEQEDCTSCHAADKSDTATDLLLPGIETCRDCHLGETAREAEVPSSCAMCHAYHPRPGAAPAPDTAPAPNSSPTTNSSPTRRQSRIANQARRREE